MSEIIHVCACLRHTPAKVALILTDAEWGNESAGLSQGPFHNLSELITENLRIWQVHS